MLTLLPLLFVILFAVYSAPDMSQRARRNNALWNICLAVVSLVVLLWGTFK